MQQTRAPRRSRPMDFRQTPPRQPSGSAIDFRDPARNPFRLGPGLPIQMAAQHGFELFFEDRRAHLIFSFYSPVLYFYRNGLADVNPLLVRSIYREYNLDMELLELELAPLSTLNIAPDRRRDPEVRHRMSGPAMRTFFHIADRWSLNTEEQRALLGWPPESTFYKYKTGRVSTLSYDMLMRISLILGIYKAIQILYPEPDLADRWVKLPNSNPLFGGRPAMALMTEGGTDGLYQVRRLLDGRRGGWN